MKKVPAARVVKEKKPLCVSCRHVFHEGRCAKLYSANRAGVFRCRCVIYTPMEKMKRG